MVEEGPVREGCFVFVWNELLGKDRAEQGCVWVAACALGRREHFYVGKVKCNLHGRKRDGGVGMYVM